RRRHTRSDRDWSSDVCSSDLFAYGGRQRVQREVAKTPVDFREFIQRAPQRHDFAVERELRDQLFLFVHHVSKALRQTSESLVNRSEERRVGKECRDQW